MFMATENLQSVFSVVLERGMIIVMPRFCIFYQMEIRAGLPKGGEMEMRKIRKMAACVLVFAIVLTGCGGANGEQGTDTQTNEQAGTQGTDAQVGTQGSDAQAGAQGSDAQGLDAQANEQGTDAQAGTQGSDVQANEQGTDAQAGAQGTDAQAGTQGSDTQTGAQASDAGGITEEKAKEIAFADAGVSEGDVTGIRVKKEIDDGREEYQVEFFAGNTEYDYEIEAATGAILGKDMEAADSIGGQASNGGTISSDDAVAIVLQKLPEAKESDVRVQLDTDDGRTVYEGSVYLPGSRREYEFEIDASTGEIISWEED